MEELTLSRLVEEYRQQLGKRHHLPFFIPRRFMTREDWTRLPAEDTTLFHDIFPELRPDLVEVLSHQHVVILGEPGCGKTTLARAAVLRFLEWEQGQILPFHADLASYRGDLSELLNRTGPYSRASAAVRAGEAEFQVAYVLDGLDEVPPEHLDQFVADLRGLLTTESGARLVLTCRQAYYESVRSRLPVPLREFYPLGFSSEDIRTAAVHFGIDPDGFFQELARADMELEASNPFTLDVLIKTFGEESRLHSLRSGNLKRVVDALIDSRPRFAKRKQRRALRMLATAMEVYARNELSEDEAVRVLVESMDIDETEAKGLLDDMCHSILLRTRDGFRFQMRSYGEYLAAEELQNEPLERILDLACFENTHTPIVTWRNAVGYLMEVHGELRQYFVHRHPDWALNASPEAFLPKQRDDLVKKLLVQLDMRQEFLVDHPVINHRRVARGIVRLSVESNGSRVIHSTTPFCV